MNPASLLPPSSSGAGGAAVRWGWSEHGRCYGIGGWTGGGIAEGPG